MAIQDIWTERQTGDDQSSVSHTPSLIRAYFPPYTLAPPPLHSFQWLLPRDLKQHRSINEQNHWGKWTIPYSSTFLNKVSGLQSYAPFAIGRFPKGVDCFVLTLFGRDFANRGPPLGYLCFFPFTPHRNREKSERVKAAKQVTHNI